MAKIMLFGSYKATGIPQELVNWLYQYTQQGHEFIVGDNKGADVAFHKALSSVGAVDNTTIYSMGNPTSNIYKIKSRVFDTFFNEAAKQAEIVLRAADGNPDPSFEPVIIENIPDTNSITLNSKWYEFKDRQMINDCDMAICLWLGDSKSLVHCIQLLNIKNKPCYTFKLD